MRILCGKFSGVWWSGAFGDVVKGGHAWHYSHYDKTPEYTAAEIAVRAAKLGLWSGENPINPYRWRKGERKAAEIGK